MSPLSPQMRANLLYEDVPTYAGWIRLLLLGVLAAAVSLGIYLISVDVAGALTLFGVALFDGFLFSLVFPRRFQIFNDRVRIVLGGPFAFSISFDKIRDVIILSGRGKRRLTEGKVLSINFVTSGSGVVEIIVRRGFAVNISPSRPESFVETLNRAMKDQGAQVR